MYKTMQQLDITGIGNVKSSRKTARVDLSIMSQHNESRIDVQAFILPQISSSVPKMSIDSTIFGNPDVSPLADPKFKESKEIDILLGIDVYEDIMLEEKVKDKSGLHFRKSLFGWSELADFAKRLDDEDWDWWDL